MNAVILGIVLLFYFAVTLASIWFWGHHQYQKGYLDGMKINQDEWLKTFHWMNEWEEWEEWEEKK